PVFFVQAPAFALTGFGGQPVPIPCRHRVKRHRPCSLSGAGCACRPASPLRPAKGDEGVERRKAQPLKPPFSALSGFEGRALLRKGPRLSALHGGDFCPRARVSWFAPRLLLVPRRAGSSPGRTPGLRRSALGRSQSSEAPRAWVIVPKERGPEASRVRGTNPPAGAAPNPAFQKRPAGTPLALG